MNGVGDGSPFRPIVWFSSTLVDTITVMYVIKVVTLL